MNMRICVALLAMAATVASASVSAAEVEKKTYSQAEVEKKLEDARRRLDTAAREVAELSMSMSEYSVPQVRHFSGFAPPRAALGINLGPRGEEQAEGVPILSVSPGGAAERAGLKAGDVLLAIGDKQLKRTDDMSAREVLLKELSNLDPGEKVDVRYRRDKKVETASVTPQAADRLFTVATMPMHGRVATGAVPAFPMGTLGAMRAVGVFGSTELVPMTPKLGQYFGTDKGLLVVRAPSDSRLKLEDGDVIVDIDGRTPSNPAHAFRILGSYQAGEKLKLNVLRQKRKMSFDITIPDEPAAGSTNPFMFHQRIEGPHGTGADTVIGPVPGTMALPPPPPVRREPVLLNEPA